MRFLSGLVIVLPLMVTGCGKQACFFWTEAEGACPSQDEAIEFFGDGNQICPGPIESVDSEGDFDGELCCYDVTESSADGTCGAGAVGAGGFGSTSVTSAVGAGGASMCQPCSAFASSAFMGADPPDLCPGSDTIFDSLKTCLCSGACQSVCSSSVCTGLPATTECFDCGTDSSAGCGMQFSACVNDN